MRAPNRHPALQHAPVLLWIVGICALLETILTLAALPPFDDTALRREVMVYGAFWPGLLHGWTPVFPGQPLTMFVTYAFLHGSFMHMLFNMLILLYLAREAVQRLGQRGFLLVYLLCAIGGGAGYGLLASTNTPMLGASGAVFGLFGTSVYWEYQRLRHHRLSLKPIGQYVLGLVVMNLALYFMAGGMLAWQTHLGGFLTGLVLARIVTPTPGHRWRSG